jgi:hypothetical protein
MGELPLHRVGCEILDDLAGDDGKFLVALEDVSFDGDVAGRHGVHVSKMPLSSHRQRFEASVETRSPAAIASANRRPVMLVACAVR